MTRPHAATLIPPSTWQGSWVARKIKGYDPTPAPKWSATLIPTEPRHDVTSGTTAQLTSRREDLIG